MPPYDCAIPPSHPDFSRENVSDSEFIALLLCQIKELEAENFKKDKRISELLHCLGEGSPEDGSVAYAPQDDIPQRSARRRQQFEENERTRSSKELTKTKFQKVNLIRIHTLRAFLYLMISRAGYLWQPREVPLSL
ncbi:hypothetical protein CJJ09_003676 [Candidozyma auris]|nr:hypothetical protein CJJ09_003676 [[Candida] auris]